MTTPYPSPLDAMAGLLEERNRYEGWLAQLVTHGRNTPTHVLERVRTDYQERLQGVLDQLRSRASELEVSASQMEQRIAVLQSDEEARSDERAEGELRAAVGEFSPEYARELLARCDEAIGRLSSERHAISSELARVQEVLALVRRPTPPAAAPRPATPPTAAKPRVNAPAQPAAPPRQVAPSPPAAAAVGQAEPLLTTNEAGSFDELAFLQSVVDPRADAVPPIADMVVPPLAGARRAASSSAEQAAQSAQTTPATRAAVSTPDDMPAFLKDAPTEQAKTLKCQECGTMNYATEWYCERCGGELAAM